MKVPDATKGFRYGSFRHVIEREKQITEKRGGFSVRKKLSTIICVVVEEAGQSLAIESGTDFRIVDAVGSIRYGYLDHVTGKT